MAGARNEEGGSGGARAHARCVWGSCEMAAEGRAGRRERGHMRSVRRGGCSATLVHFIKVLRGFLCVKEKAPRAASSQNREKIGKFGVLLEILAEYAYVVLSSWLA